MPLYPLPTPSQIFQAVNHSSQKNTFQQGDWHPLGANRFSGTITNMAKPVELTLHSLAVKPKGGLVVAENQRATLAVGPSPLPTSLSVLLSAESYDIVQVPLSGTPHEIEAEELMAIVGLLNHDDPAVIRSHLRVLCEHYHIVVFDFTTHRRRGSSPLLELLAA